MPIGILGRNTTEQTWLEWEPDSDLAAITLYTQAFSLCKRQNLMPIFFLNKDGSAMPYQP